MSAHWLKYVLGGVLILLLCCNCGLISIAFSSFKPANVSSTPPAPSSDVATPSNWVGDDFGTEQSFPTWNNDPVTGPAIAEINGQGGYCALVKINAGESLSWNAGGAWWQAFSQAGLEARFVHHEAEYSAKWPKCKIYLHAYEVK
jgi:hypothetical protein